jgi:beta-phosphoglucomutase family hydrolase
MTHRIPAPGVPEGRAMTSRNEAMEDRRAVLWDLDGTLVDSAEQHWQAWHETIQAHGFTVTRDQFRETFGRRNDAILAHWLGADLPAEQARAIGDAKEALYRDLVKRDGLTPLPGAAEWVRALQTRDWRQAVASSAPRLNIEVVVDALGLGQYFEAQVGAEDVRLGKPEPEVFLVAARRLGTPPQRCVVVEDAPAGIEAARRAGMASIGVRHGGLAEASVTVPSLVDLADDVFDRLVGA